MSEIKKLIHNPKITTKTLCLEIKDILNIEKWKIKKYILKI